MRIGIDARYAFRQERRGIGRSLANLLQALAEVDTENEYVLYLDGLASHNRLVDFRAVRWRLKMLPAPNPFLWEQVFLPSAVKRDKIDVLHCPANIAPLRQNCPTILTLYDVIEFRRGIFQTAGLPIRHRISRFYRMGVLPRAIRSVTRVVTASQYSATDVQEVVGVDAGHITVIPLAIDPFFLDHPSSASVRETTERLSVRGKFILALAALDMRKNTGCVLEAFAILKSLGLDARLVLVGSEDVRRQGLEVHPRWLEIKDDVTLLSYVSDRELKNLYHAARVFVYPSLYEGFGLPPLEAMACGTPVLCSNASSLPEVVGDAAILFDPRDARELAGKLHWLLAHPEAGRELVERGRRRVCEFSWDAIARSTLAVYEEVAKGAGKG